MGIVFDDPTDREGDLEAGRQGVRMLADDLDAHAAPEICEDRCQMMIPFR